MKKTIYLLLIAYWLVVFLSGCNSKAETEFLKIELQNTPEKVQSFVDRNEYTNGVYLYSDNNIDNYLFLNAFNVIQGEKAVFLKDVKYDIKENTLNICFNTDLAEDYTKKIDNSLLYKIKASNNYDIIKVFRNGKEIAIDAVGN